MGRGSSKSNAGEGVNPKNIVNTEDMISARNDSNKSQVDDVLKVAKAMTKQYGNDVAIEGTFKLANFKGKDSNVLGCYSHDGSITMNKTYMTSKNLDSVMDESFKRGYHPSRGNKSGVEAVAAHEYGHSLTANVQKKMGLSNYGVAATRIVTEARIAHEVSSAGSKPVSFTTNKSWRKSISGYGAGSDIEAIAEAVSDVYCNGNKASSKSRAIVDVMTKYLKKSK